MPKAAQIRVARGAFGLRAHLSWKMDGLFHWVVWPFATLFALTLLQLIGIYQFDFSLQGYSQHLQSQMRIFEEQTGAVLPSLPISPENLGLLQLCIMPLSPLIHGLVIAGEELAFRGWLFNRLRSNGDDYAVRVSSIAWALWSTPFLLLSHDSLVSVGISVLGYAYVAGPMFAQSRLQSGTIMPAIIGHSMIIGSAQIPLLLGAVGSNPESLLLGWGGPLFWLLPVLVRATKKPPKPPPFIEQIR